MLFAILKTKKLPANCNLRKIHKQFRKTQPPANSTQADSEAILPNRTQLVFLRQISLGKTVFSVRQKGVSPLLLPASVLQLPRCLVRICNLFHKGKQTANWQVSKSAIAAGKTDCKIEFASQMWATRPHLGSIFVKLLHRKTFRLPAARIL